MKEFMVFLNVLILNPLLKALGFKFGRKERRIVFSLKEELPLLQSTDLFCDEEEYLFQIFPVWKDVDFEECKMFLEDKGCLFVGANLDSLVKLVELQAMLAGKKLISFDRTGNATSFFTRDNCSWEETQNVSVSLKGTYLVGVKKKGKVSNEDIFYDIVEDAR